MFKCFFPRAIIVVLALTGLHSAPAFAASLVTYVSGKGTDRGTCASSQSPCRTFQSAINQTGPGGEVKALDPANYGPVTITKSISIEGLEGAGIDTTSGNAITINAGANDKISLTRLTLNGTSSALGIVFHSGGSFTLAQCAIRNFAQGILFIPSAGTRFLMTGSIVSGSSARGILIQSSGSGSARGTVDHVSTVNNGHDGLAAFGSGTDITVVESVASGNGASGFAADLSGTLRLAHSTATTNINGFFIGAGSTGVSFGNNHLSGNNFDVSGTLTLVGTR
jgi:Right handed beta helix region